MAERRAHPRSGHISENSAGSSSLTRADVAKVAMLARLALADEELDSLTDELGQIIKYVEQLSELATEGVEPLAHASEIHNVFRDDISIAGLDREAALGNAPSRDDECFRVPAVLGE